MSGVTVVIPSNEEITAQDSRPQMLSEHPNKENHLTPQLDAEFMERDDKSDSSPDNRMITESLHNKENHADEYRPTMLRSESPNSLPDQVSMHSDRPSMISDSPSMIENLTSGNEEKLGRSDEDSTGNVEEKLTKAPVKRGKRKKYQKYTPEDRYAIGKYCFEHGPAAARKAFQDRYPEMSESVTRGFRDKYKQIIGETAVYEFEQRRQREYAKRSGPLPRGRPRKYKQLEEDEISASMVARNPSPQSSEISHHTLSPPRTNGGHITSHNAVMSHEVNSRLISPTLMKNRSPPPHYERFSPEHSVSDHENYTNSALLNYSNKKEGISLKSTHVHPFRREETELSLADMQKIGKMCSQDGIEMTLRKTLHDFPNLKVEDIRIFHNRYLESVQQNKNSKHHDHHVTSPSTTSNPQVFILENENQHHSSSDKKVETKPMERSSYSDDTLLERTATNKETTLMTERSRKYANMSERSNFSFVDERGAIVNKTKIPSLRNERPLSVETYLTSKRYEAPPRKTPSPLDRYGEEMKSYPSSAYGRYQYDQHRSLYRKSHYEEGYQKQLLEEGYYRRAHSLEISPQNSPTRDSPPTVSRVGYQTGIPVSTVVSSQSVHQAVIHYPKETSSEYLIRHDDDSSSQRIKYSEDISDDHLKRGDKLKRDYRTAFENPEYTSYPYEYLGYERSLTNENRQSQTRSKRFKYQKYTPEDRYNIGKLCNEIGLGATVKVYREQFPRLNESVVRTFRNKYRELVEKGNGEPAVEAIERKPSRRSMSSMFENEVVAQLRQFKISKIELSERLVLAVCENVISTKDSREMVGLRSLLTKEWASSLLWKHKLIDKLSVNVNNMCCERCQTKLICPKCN